MIPRMTTVGTLKNYRYGLNRSNNTMSKMMTTVLTRRNFNSYAEDPALATRCFQIRHSYQRAEAQLTVNDSLRHKYDVGWSALESVSVDLYSQADDTSIYSILRSINDPTGPGRLALGQSLEAKAKDIAQIMNGRYGENYVFAGADTLNAPFTWEPQVNPEYIAPEVAVEKANDPALTAAEQAKYQAACKYVMKNDDGSFSYSNDPKVLENPADGWKENSVENFLPEGSPDPKTFYNEDTEHQFIDVNGDFTDDADASVRDNPDYIDPDVAVKKLAEQKQAEEEQKANPDTTVTLPLTDEEVAKYQAACKYVIIGKEDPTDPNCPETVLGYTNDPKAADGTDNRVADNNADTFLPDDAPKADTFYNEDTAPKYVDIYGELTGEISEAAEVLCYRGVPVDSMADDDQEKQNYFDDESKIIDLGLGHKERDGEAIDSTVFDSALQGTYFLGGHGTKEVTLEDGTVVKDVPRNVISVVNELGQILRRCDSDDGGWHSPEDEQRFEALTQEFEDSNNLFRERWTEMDTQSSFLRDNSELLDDTAYSLKQQYLELEEADPAAAISEYMFARYAYDAALKVGNSVLSQSLMDYMQF